VGIFGAPKVLGVASMPALPKRQLSNQGIFKIMSKSPLIDESDIRPENLNPDEVISDLELSFINLDDSDE
jgi:hypothetical protein